ncbi:MAG TPA: cupin domain-containing protein [Polyangia bacterium]|jgi:quercetin dioxygenase-like cupin family protein
MATNTAALPPAQPLVLAAQVDYGAGSIVSRAIVQKKTGSLTLFAFDAGQALSEHTAPFDAWVQVLDGEAELVIGGTPITVRAGEAALMPANVPHAVNAKQRFKMLLSMIRGE